MNSTELDVAPILDTQAALDRAMTLELRIRDCDRLLASAVAFANGRWDEERQSFRDGPEAANQVHVVNTSTALTIISSYRRIFTPESITAFGKLDPVRVAQFYIANYDAVRQYWNSKDTQAWTPYVSSLAVRAVAAYAIFQKKSGAKTLDESLPAEASIRTVLPDEVSRLLKFVEKWALREIPKELGDYDHTYFVYTALDALHEIETGGASEIFKLDAERMTGVRRKALDRLRLELYSQMTFTLAEIPQHLDVVSLALSLVSLVRFGDDAEALPDEVINAALETIFSLQQTTGFWQTGALLGIATGRVGCSSIELATCLLKLDRVVTDFDRFADHFDRLFQHHARASSPATPARGWSVELRRDGNARQTWYGFFVYEFFARLEIALRRQAAALIHRGFQYTSPAVPKVTWKDLGDFCGSRDRVSEVIVQPWRRNAPKQDRKCSLILFGPPGTGKTTFARALAGELQWGLIEIGPGDFLAQGVDRVFARGESIFQRLLLLDHVVVLFDEIDEWVHYRGDDVDKMSRFLTTYMLPWIQRLRDKASIVFIFATNNVERFDPAIKRPGRFDLVVPYGPPQDKERARILGEMRLSMSPTDLDSIAASAPRWATIGDITNAIHELKRRGIALSPDAITKAVTSEPEVKEKDWTAFLKQAAYYTDVSSLSAGDVNV